MITVVMKKSKPKPSLVYFSDIDEGTVFSGRIEDVDGRTYSGIWLMVNDGYIDGEPKMHACGTTVLINREFPKHPGKLLSLGSDETDLAVENFVELNATLTVSPKFA